MTFGAERCGWVSKDLIVSGEGFTKDNAARCGQKNCLNGGVHPIGV